MQSINEPAVLVNRGRITAVIDARALPNDIPVVDHRLATLLPGLVDAHVHLCFRGSDDPLGDITRTTDEDLLEHMRAAARTTLAAGITTVRDLGDRGYLTLRLRSETQQALSAGPEILAAGPPVTTPGGHCWFLGGAATGRAGLRALVHRHRARGVDVIKVMVSGGRMTPGSTPWQEQYGIGALRALVRDAHECGLPAAAHAHAPASIDKAVRAGFDTIEHATFLTQGGVEPDRATLDRVARSGAFVSPATGIHPRRPPLSRAQQEHHDSVTRLVGAMRSAGVKIACSSDAGVSLRKPHGLLPYAVEVLQHSGFPPVEALGSATSAAAEACGVGDRKGRLAPGFDADVLVVAGDPSTDVRVLQRVVAVYRAGRRVVGG